MCMKSEARNKAITKHCQKDADCLDLPGCAICQCKCVSELCITCPDSYLLDKIDTHLPKN